MALVRITKGIVDTYIQDEEWQLSDEIKAGAMILNACNHVASYVNKCPLNNRLKTGSSSVPEELVKTTCILIKHDLISTVPGSAEALEGTSRSAEYNNAISYLRDVANCNVELSPFGDEQDEPSEVIWGGSPYQDWSHPI